MTERAWRPPVEDRLRDWVASILAPALKILRTRRGDAACKAFCALGAGVGLDAIAGIEVLGAELVGVHDLFPDVAEAAADNVRRNLAPGHSVAVCAGAGDLLQPFRASNVKFDLIYENLPNLPLADAAEVEVASTSAAFLAPRSEPVPQAVRRATCVCPWASNILTISSPILRRPWTPPEPQKARKGASVFAEESYRCNIIIWWFINPSGAEYSQTVGPTQKAAFINLTISIN